MAKKIKKPSQARPRMSSQATRSTKTNIIVNKAPKVKKEAPGPSEMDIDDIILG